MSEIRVFKTEAGEDRRYRMEDGSLQQEVMTSKGEAVWCSSYFRDFEALTRDAKFVDVTPEEESLDFLNDLGSIDPTSYHCEGADDCDGCKI